MIELLSLIGGLKGLLIGALGLLGGLFAWWQKKQKDNLRQERDEAQAANQVYQAKEKVHTQDQATDMSTDGRLDEVVDAVNAANTEQEKADEMARAFNRYFGDPK